MNQALKEQLIKRLKSFVWRVGAYAVIGGIALVIDMLGMIEANPVIVTIVSLAGGEITKYINSPIKKTD